MKAASLLSDNGGARGDSASLPLRGGDRVLRDTASADFSGTALVEAGGGGVRAGLEPRGATLGETGLGVAGFTLIDLLFPRDKKSLGSGGVAFGCSHVSVREMTSKHSAVTWRKMNEMRRPSS